MELYLIEKPSPRLVGFYIFTSGVGTWLGEAYSSLIVNHFGVVAIIFVSALMMFLVIVIMMYVAVANKNIDLNKTSLH